MAHKYNRDMFDITVHDLMNLDTADTPAAVLIRSLCADWVADSIKRAGPNGPRIGTIILENDEGGLTLRLATRLGYPENLGSGDSEHTAPLRLVRGGKGGS